MDKSTYFLSAYISLELTFSNHYLRNTIRVCIKVWIKFIRPDMSPYVFYKLKANDTSSQRTTPEKDVALIFEPRHEISNNVVYATSKGSDQPAHTRSLIRAFAGG